MKTGQFLALSFLPNSAIEPLMITSPDDGTYNCVAWALGRSDAAFWPLAIKPYEWPKDLPMHESVEVFILFFQKHGFVVCESGEAERGFEKIAIFEKEGQPTHACRLLKNGLWTSKIGILEDVQHLLWAISGGMYGEVAAFMKRKIVKISPPPATF